MNKNLFISIFLAISFVVSQAFGMSSQQDVVKQLEKSLSTVQGSNIQSSNITAVLSKIKNVLKKILYGDIDTVTQLMLIPAFVIFTSTIHEFGHYGAAKLLAPEVDSKIHLFCDNCSSDQVVFSVGDLSVHAKTFLQSVTEMSPSVLSNPANLFIVGAGPAADLVAGYFFLFVKTFMQKYIETKKIKESIVFAFQHSHKPFENLLKRKELSSWQFLVRLFTSFSLVLAIADQFIYGFLPLIKEGDGWMVWEKFINKDNLFLLHDIAGYTELLALILILIKTCNCFCSFMLNEKTIFHALWNRVACPVGRGIKSIPSRLKSVWSYISQRIMPSKQKTQAVFVS